MAGLFPELHFADPLRDFPDLFVDLRGIAAEGLPNGCKSLGKDKAADQLGGARGLCAEELGLPRKGRLFPGDFPYVRDAAQGLCRSLMHFVRVNLALRCLGLYLLSNLG